MRQLPDALAALGNYRQFVVCQYVPDPDKPGKTKKYPINIATGRQGDAHDPALWLDHVTACATAAAWGLQSGPSSFGYGVGFTITKDDPFFFIDADGCVTPEGGYTPIVHELAAQLPGAAIELSQSMSGIHILGIGQAPDNRRIKDRANTFDLYTDKRFVALTGHNIVGNVATYDHSQALHAIAAKWLRLGENEGGPPAEWTIGPADGWRGPVNDEDLLARMMRSQSARAAFGQAASFADLWQCNVDVLAVAYPPDPNGRLPYDGNRVDAALAQHLAYWTGKDCERIKRLMLQSGLVRDKWEEREEGYLDVTILKACTLAGEFLTDKAPEENLAVPAAPANAAEGTLVSGNTMLSSEEQIVHFAGCTYICDVHAVLCPGGVLMRSEQFRVMYGGICGTMDPQNRASRDAFEIFTQSQLVRFPRADSYCFRPDLEPGAIVTQDERKLVNIYWPLTTQRKVGDVTPFLRHLELILPDQRDRTILLAYMCAVVQHKGKKFGWMPVIQGAEGNGKTILTRCVSFAIGNRYSYSPKASDIADKFNDWLYGNIFIGIDDIYVPHGKAEVIEELKPMISEDRQQIQGKGEKKRTREVCCNLMANSNHKDGVMKHKNDRRLCMLFTAQQSLEDIMASGMGGSYFPDLWAWMRADGFAIVSELLHTMPIPDEFNPATLCSRAPVTSSTDMAIEASRTSLEQEILEAVQQGLPGFRGGWISSMAIDRLLETQRRGNLPRNKRRDMLKGLGYDWHPGLADGRVANEIAPDGGKPRLYLVKGHPALALTRPVDIAKAYSEVQNVPVLSHV